MTMSFLEFLEFLEFLAMARPGMVAIFNKQCQP